jgi:NADPH-dependent glutamate synthase beta subunit-like oxidoreductase/ferredoxin
MRETTIRTSAQAANAEFDSESTPRRLYPPCRSKCPVHIDIPGYLTAIAEDRFTDALEIVLERNPLPSVCGRVCLRPCEEGCRRCQLDEPVAICSLKRAAADFGSYPVVRRSRPRAESVAIVGGGPAGLTVAHDLAQLGFGITIYEEKARLGGMMRYGIPAYRLPDVALDNDVGYILSHGVKVEPGIRVGRDISIDELLKCHDAVVVTAGLQASRPLPIPGATIGRTLTALPFLAAARRGEKVDLGKKVVVIGGGNVAMDVARTARRMGEPEVHVVCLESDEEMPASEEELHEARTEGIKIHCSWGPREVLGDEEAGVCGLSVMRCTSVFDENRRFSPTFDESVVEQFEADTIIFATGQSADVADLGIELTPRGAIVVDPLTLKTSAERVYAAGDVVSGPTKIIDAVAAGHRVAACVVRDLIGDAQPLAALDEENVALGEVPPAMKSKLELRRRVQMERLEFYDAVRCFDEVESGYTEYEAMREAQRCLGCTTGATVSREKCSACLTCVRVCPHGAPGVKIGGFLYFDAEACHACGACASQCPAQAISLAGYTEEEMDRRVDRVLRGARPGTTLLFECSCTPNLPMLAGGDVRELTVPCLLRVSERAVIRALRTGAARVAFTGCVEATCRYPHARDFVAERAARVRSVLSQLGMEDAFVMPGQQPAEELDHLR